LCELGGCGPGSGRLSAEEENALKRRREALPRLETPATAGEGGGGKGGGGKAAKGAVLVAMSEELTQVLEHVNGSLLPRLVEAANRLRQGQHQQPQGLKDP
jgi:hypothetical protein